MLSNIVVLIGLWLKRPSDPDSDHNNLKIKEGELKHNMFIVPYTDQKHFKFSYICKHSDEKKIL